ncbi:MAG: hypothetical protein [Microviridae sp.]|nr:MAG: hypothetical protein [Microviridae sp.]
MDKYNDQYKQGTINFNEAYEADPLEIKIARVLQNNEPIDSSAPLIYTERKDGVLPGYDIRTDRFDVAIEAMDGISRSNTARRMERIKAETAANTSEQTTN